MNHPQSDFAQPLIRPWHIRRPGVYRYLDTKYVDEFFQIGRLRISSFNRFAEHSDEQRADVSEGFCFVMHRNSEGTGQTIFSTMSFGKNAFVLCGSTVYSDALKNAFGTEDGFKITDPTKFGEAIAFHIPGFARGLEGLCHYLPVRSISRDMGPQDLSRFQAGQNGTLNAAAEQFLGQVASNDPFFIKHQSYFAQSEYRLLWFTYDSVPPHIDIVCPEARQFCTRFRDLFDEHAPDSPKVAEFHQRNHAKLMRRTSNEAQKEEQ